MRNAIARYSAERTRGEKDLEMIKKISKIERT
jgi:hypothetical protein